MEKMIAGECKREVDQIRLPKKKTCHGLGESQIVHFSFALPRFIKPQVAHFHPPSSEGGLSPAAPQLNPPSVPSMAAVVAVVVKDGGPNPAKLWLDPALVGSGAPNENPDVVEVDGVELDTPNRNDPGGGVGIEKTLLGPVPEPEEGAPGFGASQTAHFSFADAGFIKSHVPHFHPSAFVVGGFIPAALQSKPPELEFVGAAVFVEEVLLEAKTKGVEGGFSIENDGAVEDLSAPSFGASQTVHFSVADAGFIKSHVAHFQPSIFVGGFNPAELQLNPPELELAVDVIVVASVVGPNESGVGGGLGIEEEDERGFAAPGLGASHTVHFSVAETGFIRSHVPHFHPSSGF